MADFVHNKIVCPKEIGERILTKTEKGYVFDFNKLIPIPEGFDYDLPSGGIEKESVGVFYNSLSDEEKKIIKKTLSERYFFNGEVNYWWKYSLYIDWVREGRYDLSKEEYEFKNSSVYKKAYPGCESLIDVGKKYVVQISKYGFANWYDWQVTNWGTKWNALDSQVKFSEESDTYEITFDTAYTAPKLIMAEYAKLCSDDQFNWEVSDEFGKHSKRFALFYGKIILADDEKKHNSYNK